MSRPVLRQHLGQDHVDTKRPATVQELPSIKGGKEDMKLALFITAIAFELLYGVLFALTIALPGFRFWPPPSQRSWQFFASWLIASLVAVCFLFLGFLDFDGSFLHQWLRFPIAFALLICGSIIGTWSFLSLGLRTTLGLGDKLITHGPYRLSRNPQYLGDSLSIIGYMVFSNSAMVWGVGFLGILLNFLAPFTEEPWLEERFGAAYLEYKCRVPRFIGPKRGK